MVAASIGPSGEALVLWSDQPGKDALCPTELDSRTERPVHATVCVYAPGGARRSVPIHDLSLTFPLLQPLPDGRVLIVGSRCSWRPGGPEKNAVVYNPSGEAEVAATLGDGISHVLATALGDVWVAYYDEGIFGNLGWAAPSGPDPVGVAGIVRFDKHLSQEWMYPFHAEPGPVYDCYALNVFGTEAWAYYYDQFPIVRIGTDEVTGWKNSIAGARALLVAEQGVALVGGYRDERSRCVFGTLSDSAFEPLATTHLVMPDGKPWPDNPTLIGRSDELHAIFDRTWYKLCVADL
jgi:hypothetical protein